MPLSAGRRLSPTADREVPAMLRRGFFRLCGLYELNENGHRNRMVVFCIVSGVIVAVGLFWLKVAIPAWRDFDQSRRPHVPLYRPYDDDLNDLLEHRSLSRRGKLAPADTPIKVREFA
jgi:hypothetical protein